MIAQSTAAFAMTILVCLFFYTVSMQLILRITRSDDELKTAFDTKPQLFLLWLVHILCAFATLIITVNEPFGMKVLVASFFAMLLSVAYIDAVTSYIYDLVLLGFSLFHILLIFLLKMNIGDMVLGALIGFLLYLFIYLAARLIYKKEVFGFGDVLLMGAIGIVVGKSAIVLAALMPFYVSAIILIPYMLIKKTVHLKTILPFGPFICIAAGIVWVFNQAILDFYISIILL
ncbi:MULTISPECIES: A24 family peptidase [unclassified Fusibacter]|uniref:prepilin peptidase n=1 Tax=unclassified Fusibacter TaxID=2624464 RepID=UPI001010FF82|nr:MULTISPECIES: prepilin peptidase [unclassified Fusibacter]MCK8058893.1 prepilin peptidase [Fusibacter sp. A2]NPE21967.1 hypothetical protein [Fusibacter sp. A1]RXV61535.1 hypothetical protein DWB64_08990 [Fusibacter sp. A1]